MDTVNLDLTTMGDLNRDSKEMLKALVQSMKDATDKASLTITIALERVKDTDTMLRVTHSVKPNFPKKAHAILARQDLVGNLMTEATPAQKNIFALNGAKEGVVNNG